MPIQTTITYGPGKQLQNESEARAWLLGVNPVTDDKNYYIAVDNGAVLRLTPDTVLQNSDDTRRVTIGPAAGQSFKELNPGVHNVLANMTGPRVRIPRGQYTTPIGSGIDFKKLIVEVEAGGAGNGVVFNQRRDGSAVDNKFDECRIIDLSANGASVFGFGFNNNRTVIDDCLVVVEGVAGKNVFDNRGETKVNRTQFVARGTAAGNATVAVSEYVGAAMVDCVFIGFGPKIADATVAMTNCYSNTTPTAGRTADITVVTAAGGLVENEASNYRPSESSPLINAATDAADKTDDNNGDYRGDVADVGAFQRTPQARPVISDATITSVVVDGRRVTITATLNNPANTGTISLLKASDNSVAVSKAATINGLTATAQFDLVNPLAYAKATAIMVNEAGPGVSIGGNAFTVSAPPVPTATITSVVKSGRNVEISGTYTGIYPNEPITGLVTLTGASGGATTKSAAATLRPNGTFSGLVASNTYGEYNQTSVAVTNFSGTGTDTDAGVSILSPAVAVGAALTPITFENTSATAKTDMPVTFAQPFKFGVLPTAGANVVLRASDNSTVPCQLDVRVSNEDGSVRHAVISAILPSLAGNESKTYTIERAAAPATPTPAVVSDFVGLDSVVTITQGATVYTLSVATLLAGTKTNWLSGNVVSEWEVSGIPKTAGNVEHPHIHVRAHVRGYKGQNKARIDLSIENDWAWNPSPQDVTYDLSITIGGNAFYTKAGLVHYVRARHRHVGWWNTPDPAVHIKHDIPYLPATRAVPNYDLTTAPSLTKANEYYNNTVTNGGPMGTGTAEKGMFAVGGRPDIGILPAWSALYLISMFKPAKDAVLNQGNLAGSWSMHFRDKNTGRVLSLQDWPHFATIGTSGDNVNPATGQSELAPYPSTNANPAAADVSHHPDQWYVAYLLTGDIYYAEEGQFWMLNCVISQNSHATYRNGGAGLIRGEQTRGQAWTLRTMAHAAYILPPALGQTEATRLLKSNLDFFDALYTNNTVDDFAKLGVIVNGYSVGYSTDESKGKTGVAPWQDDFFTSAVGRMVEMGMEYARPLFNWKAKFPVARLYGVPGTHWQQAAAARMRVKESEEGAFYTNYLQVYQGTFSPDILTEAAKGPAATQEMATAWNNYNAWATANGYSGMDGVADVAIGDMDGYSTSPSGYPSNMQPAVAYAASHGAPGAAEAWSQFMARSIKPSYSTEPQFSVVPYAVEDGGTVTPPTNGVPFFSGTIANIAGTAGQAITPVNVSARFSDTDTLAYSESPTGAAWPAGLDVHPTTGVISGTVASATTVTGLKVRATDTAAQTVDSNAFSVTIAAAAAVLPAAPTSVVAEAGDEEITVNATLGSAGSSPVTSFNIVLSTGGAFTRYALPATVPAEGDVPVSAQIQAISAAGPSPLSAASNVVTPALIDDPQNNDFTPSKARTITVLPGRKEFEMGEFWTMGANGPEAEVDPDETLDIPFDWTPWLADIGGANLASAAFTLVGGVQKAGSGATTKVATVFFSATDQVGKTVAISCKIVTATTPPRTVERTVFLKIKEQ